MTRLAITALLLAVPGGIITAGAAEPTPPPAALAGRLWQIMDLVTAHHPEPPPREAMIASAAKSLLGAAKAAVPDDLERRAAAVKTREDLGALLREVWPGDAGASPAETLEGAAIEGLFARVPGQGMFVPADVAKVSAAANANRYVGIGIQLRINEKEKLPEIVSPIARGPARRAGIKSGDLFVEVDGKPTRDVPLGKVVDWLRGEEGTVVTILVRTPGDAEARTLKITRTVVPFESVLGYRRVGDDGWEFRRDADSPVAYVRLSAFRTSTPHELRQVERRLRDEGDRALVLDLRSAGNGSTLHNGELVAGALLDGAPLWRQHETGAQAREVRAGHECLFRDWPMVVLINDGVGSAEGAVAAALQDNGRAVLVGEATRNGGFVNGTFPLADGRGEVLFRTGRLERVAKSRAWPVQPDEVVALTKKQREALDVSLRGRELLDQPDKKAPEDPQLDKAMQLLRAALKK